MNEDLELHDYMHDIISLKKLPEWGSLKFVIETIMRKKEKRLRSVEEGKELFKLQGQLDGLELILFLVENTKKTKIVKKEPSTGKEAVDKYMKDA